MDRAKKFHALAYGCTTNEKTEDYTFFFQTLADSVKTIYDTQLEPKILITDGAISIRNACKMTFPSIEVMIMCYVHVIRNVNKRALSNSKKHRKLIMDDINILHLAGTEEKFDQLASLFIKKWEKVEPDFTKYFANQWLGDLKYWFVGASVFDPSDNNHVEGKFVLFKIGSNNFHFVPCSVLSTLISIIRSQCSFAVDFFHYAIQSIKNIDIPLSVSVCIFFVKKFEL